MAVAEPKHDRGRPKKRTRVVPPPKGQRGPPCVAQSATAEESMMVPRPKTTPPDHPHGKQGGDAVRNLRVAKDYDAVNITPLARLEKAAGKGEGSRGGKIIGHTKSGRAIYAMRKGGRTVLHIAGGGDFGKDLTVPGPGAKAYHLYGNVLSSKGAAAIRAMPDASSQEHGVAWEAHAAHAAHHLRLGRRAAALMSSHAAAEHGQVMLMGMHGSRMGKPVAFMGTPGRVSKPDPKNKPEGYTARGKAMLSPLPGEYPTPKDDDGGPFVSRRDVERIGETTRAHFPHYTAGDHRGAANHYERQARRLEAYPVTGSMERTRYQDATLAHRLAADAADQEANLEKSGIPVGSALDSLRKAAKRGEGSHGGKIIGHTKSGKAIYAKQNLHAYSWLHAQDHKDAAALHSAAHDDLKSKADALLFTSKRKSHARLLDEAAGHSRLAAEHTKAAKSPSKPPPDPELRPGEEWIGEGENRVLMSPWPFIHHAMKRNL